MTFVLNILIRNGELSKQLSKIGIQMHLDILSNLVITFKKKSFGQENGKQIYFLSALFRSLKHD